MGAYMAPKPKEKLLQFAEYVDRTHNKTHNIIKFVLHFHKTQIEFLELTIRVQLNEHHSSIRNSQTKITSISQHWADCKHNVAQLRWQVLEEIKTNYVNIDIVSGSGS
ncbi:hypothetical protein XELAEV_18017097mg [Xenopus laevis]|uniref:Uncharacterized protein n=1 Tax=Xenopus laevis TaxID=8355 RepID=A0A974DBU6_XENLA|nr:hypothetical protein XELAEV_18017097mg [Xenopus laevis]